MTGINTRKMKRLSPAWSLIFVWGFFTLVIVLLMQLKKFMEPNPVIRSRISRLEPFQSGSGSSSSSAADALPRLETAGGDVAPAEAALAKPKDPYNLLAGWLPGLGGLDEKAGDGKPTNALSAERCYSIDFQKNLEKTGNYRQLTNNYKRAGPDSCTAPLQDLVLPFYKTEPLPQTGCINPSSQ
jgi:hypothetical protein